MSRRALLLLMCGAGLLASAKVRAQVWTLEQMLARLAQVRSARARFVEKRQLAGLRNPLESMGVLIYEAPGRLEKIVHKPRAERMLLDGDRITLETGNGRRRREWALSESPEMAALIGGLRATLAGNATKLLDNYQVHFEGPEQHWRLTLKPRDAKAAARVHQVLIFGTGARVTSVDLRLSDGDRSVMYLANETPR